MTKAMLSFLFLLISMHITGQSLDPIIFQDQFKEEVSLDQETRFVLFSSSMHANKLVKEVFEELDWTQEDLDTMNILYVADIHRMPALISKWIAIPGMRKYDVSIALDRKGELTKDWQSKEEAVSFFQLDQLEISKLSFLSGIEALKLEMIKIKSEYVENK
jgi:hypothetical protein